MNQLMLLKINLVISPDKKHEFLSSVKQMSDCTAHQSQKEDGCLAKRLYQFVEDENAFCYMEEWNSLTKMKRYFRSDQFRALVGAIKVLGEIKEWQTFIAKE